MAKRGFGFSAKDNGCSSVTEEVAVLAREDGHQVFTALEGLAMVRYENLGFPIGTPPNWRGMMNFNSPTDDDMKLPPFDAAAFLNKTQPDIIVTGLGSPINIQRQIAEEATLRGIPLVVCSDFWAKTMSKSHPARATPSS